jgi:hypothetical protein
LASFRSSSGCSSRTPVRRTGRRRADGEQTHA